MTKNAAVPLFLLLAVLALGAAPVAVAQPVAADSSRLQADTFVEKARAALAAGSLAESADLLSSALQLSSDYSEALYLRARLELPDQDRTLAAVDDLRKALASASWTVTDPMAAEQALAEVLLRTGNLAEARTLLSALAGRASFDARTYLLLAKLYDREGDTRALRGILSDAVRRFPLEDGFALLSADLLQRQGNRAAARQVIATQLKVHPDSLALLLRNAELAANPLARVSAVDDYSSRGGKDPLAAVIALEARARGPQKYLSQFVDNGGLSHEDLVERVARAVSGSQSLLAAFRSDLSSYSGNRDLDPEGDGFYSERWAFSRGELTSWERDSRKDGQPELAAGFQNGSPVSLSVREGSRLLDFSYSAYPWIRSVKAAGQAYFPDPYTVKVPFLSGTPTGPGFAPRALRNPRPPTLDQVTAASYRIEEYGPDGATVERRIDLLRGKKIFMQEDTLGNGTFNHKVWYENGQPVRGIRDPDGSGRFSVMETWRDGKLAGIAVDTRGTGKADYWERYLPSPMKSWDYNGDGVADSREYPAGPDGVVRDFSTAMNGTFDLSYLWKKEELVRVTRRGQQVPLTHDPARGVVWIGQPARAGVKIDVDGGEGYRAVSGKMYLVFRREGTMYAEELP